MARWWKFDVELWLDRFDDFIFIDRCVDPSILKLLRKLDSVGNQKILNIRKFLRNHIGLRSHLDERQDCAYTSNRMQDSDNLRFCMKIIRYY